MKIIKKMYYCKEILNFTIMNNFKLLLITTIFTVLNSFGSCITGIENYSGLTNISSDVCIANTGVLNISGVVFMAPNTKILIEDGGQLILNGATITHSTTNTTWKGIEVEDNQLSSTSPSEMAIIATNSYISFAEKGIYNKINTSGGSTESKGMSFTNCFFFNNNAHVYLRYQPNNFTSTATNNPIIFEDTKFHGMIGTSNNTRNNELYFSNANKVIINNCEFESEATTQGLSCGVFLRDCANVSIANNHFKHKINTSILFDKRISHFKINNNIFEALDDIGYAATAGNNKYTAIRAGAYLVGAVTNELIISDNNFVTESFNNPYQLLAMDLIYIAREVYIKNNSISNYDIGLVIGNTYHAGYNYPDDVVYDITYNTFNNYDIAIHGFRHVKNIELTCNTFNEGETAIYFLHLEDQTGYAHNNYFNGSNIDIHNDSYPAVTFTYDLFNGSTPLNTIGPVQTPYVTLAKLCFLKPLKSNQNSIEPELFNNNQIVTITNLNGSSNITILNSLGQIVKTTSVITDNYEFDISEFNSGVYFANILQGSKRVTLKFIK